MSRLLERLALFARRRYGLVFTLAALAVFASGLLASRLALDTDVLHLLPQKDPAVRTFVETVEQFESLDNLLIVVRVPEGAPLDPYESLVDRLGERLGKLPELGQLTYKLAPPEEMLERFFPKALLFLGEKARPALERRLSDEGIRRHTEELRRQLGMPQAMALKQFARLDPLGLAEIFLEQMGAGRGGLQADWTSGYLLSADHRVLLLVGKPDRPPQDIDFTRRLVARVNKEIAATRAEWSEIAEEGAGQGAPPVPDIALGGGYMIALSDATTIQNEMVLNMGGSLVAVLLLFFFAFRRPTALTYAIVPLGCGLLLAFAFARLAFGSISSATSGVAALLIGMGIDFVIVSYGRYIEARRGGATVEGALSEMSSKAFLAVVLGALTTAGTFFAFCISDFRGLREMGLLTGVGILFCATAVLTLLPAMLAWTEDRRARRSREPALHLHAFGSGQLIRFSQGHPKAVILAAGALTVAALAVSPTIRFEDSMQRLRPAGNPGILVQEEVGRHFGSGFEEMMLLVKGRTAEEVLDLTERATRGAEALVRKGILKGVEGATSLLPPRDRQEEALRWLAAGRKSGALDPRRIDATFSAAARAEGLRVEAFEHGLHLLDEALSPREPITLADFQASDQTRRLLDRFLRQTPQGWSGVVYLYPPPLIYKRRAPVEAVALAQALGPQVALTGVNVMSSSLRRRVGGEAWLAGILGLVFVFLLVWWDFRNLRSAALCLLPLGMGGAWMLGSMAVLDLDMNFMNIFVTTMIIGIGTDYAIYVLQRHAEIEAAPEPEAAGAIAETGKSVVLAALTTMVGFGSLATSHYPGLASMGYVAGLGALYTCVASITVLPAVLTLLRRRAGRRAAAPPAA